MKILNTKQAAKILGINASRVRQLILSGRLPAQKLGRDWIIQEKDLKKVSHRKPGRPKKERK
jgi:excisionase family DNA binding protein